MEVWRRRDLADAAGLSRVHVARTLESLRERRLAEIQNGTLVIFDRPRLTELAGYVPLGTAAGRRALLYRTTDISAAIIAVVQAARDQLVETGQSKWLG